MVKNQTPPETPKAGDNKPPVTPPTPPKEPETPPQPPEAPPQEPPVTETLQEIEARIDEKLQKLKVAEYNAKLGGTTQVMQQQTEEQKTKAECNKFLQGTGFQI